jgi:predicted acyl esterase
MARALALAFVLGLICCGNALAVPWTKTDQTITASDGAPLATTLYEPATAPPVGGWPAIVMFHGIGGTRASMNQIAEQVFAPAGYAVLTLDLRGHGQSGGLFDADGPRTVQDVKEELAWLDAHPEIDRAHVGAWGISLGGGLVYAALKAGIPFAAAEVYETWVDLYEALAPNNLSKSGAIFQFLNSVPAERTAPEIAAIRSDALSSTNQAATHAFGDARSAVDTLPQVKTPVMVFQGRRDFAFDLQQGLTAYAKLGGPKRIYIGDFGHAPSTFPGPDQDAMFAAALDWFNHYLRGTSIASELVSVTPDPWRGSAYTSNALPRTTSVTTKTLKVRKRFGWAGKAVLTLAAPSRGPLETFGAPVVTVTASTKTRARQLVAVLEAIAPDGKSTLVTEGGTLLPTASKAWTLSFPLISDATLIPKGAKLRLTLSWTSVAQSSANLLYLQGVPVGSSLTITRARVTLPVLRQALSQ